MDLCLKLFQLLEVTSIKWEEVGVSHANYVLKKIQSNGYLNVFFGGGGGSIGH